MPFTPFHMGFASTVKLILRRWFSFTLFGHSQILIDSEVLLFLYLGRRPLHGFNHTYVGALVIGLVAAVTGKYLCQVGLRLWNLIFLDPRFQVPTTISWPVAFLSAYIGTLSHIFIDSFMHTHQEPWWPFSKHNEMLGKISVPHLHDLLVALGFIGFVGLLILWARDNFGPSSKTKTTRTHSNRDDSN